MLMSHRKKPNLRKGFSEDKKECNADIHSERALAADFFFAFLLLLISSKLLFSPAALAVLILALALIAYTGFRYRNLKKRKC